MGPSHSKRARSKRSLDDVQEDFHKDLQPQQKNSKSSLTGLSLWLNLKDKLGFISNKPVEASSNEAEQVYFDDDNFELIDPEAELADQELIKASLTVMDSSLTFPFLTEERSKLWISKNKTMFILRGLSGSGKSTIAREITSTYPGTVVCSADDYFINKDTGEYLYQREELTQAHEFCQKKAKEACEAHTTVVVIDNTNVMRWEMNFYFKLASQNGYKIVLAEPKTSWSLDPSILASRNKHGVTADILASKLGKFKPVCPTFFGWFANLKDSQAVLQNSRIMMKRCIEGCDEFRADVERMTKTNVVEDMIGYFSRSMCLPSSKDIVHCTAKFCGPSGCPAYADKQVVKDSLGKAFDLAIIGYVITDRTFGARIMLDEDELLLYDQDDDGTDKPSKLTNGKRKKPVTAKGLDLSGGDESVNESALRFEDLNIDEVKDRFYPIPGRGRRAHVTLGTAPGIAPVITGYDVLEVVNFEKLAHEGAQNFAQFDIGDDGTVLRQYDEGIWVIYPLRRAVTDALFTGQY